MNMEYSCYQPTAAEELRNGDKGPDECFQKEKRHIALPAGLFSASQLPAYPIPSESPDVRRRPAHNHEQKSATVCTVTLFTTAVTQYASKG